MHLLAPIRLLAQVTEEPTTEPSGIDLLLPASSELLAGLIAFAIIFLINLIQAWQRRRVGQ